MLVYRTSWSLTLTQSCLLFEKKISHVIKVIWFLIEIKLTFKIAEKKFWKDF